MSTAKRVKTPPLEMRIQATIMACREELMQYFKGTCVERQTRNTSLSRRSSETRRYPYQYQRLESEQRSPQILMLGRVPICQLEKLPDKVVLYSRMLDQSPGLREVDRGIKYFLDKYLSGVQLKTNAEYYAREIDDERLFTAEVAEDRDAYKSQNLYEIYNRYTQMSTSNYSRFDTITLTPGSLWGTADSSEMLIDPTTNLPF